MLLEPILPVTSLLVSMFSFFFTLLYSHSIFAKTFVTSIDDQDYAVSLSFFFMVYGFLCFTMSRKVHVADPKELGEILI